jgi:hypothetical protein
MRSTPASAAACEHGTVHLAARRGRHHHELRDARHFRGDGAHQHGRRIRGFPAGHVEAYAIDRRHLLPEHRAFGVLDAPGILHLALVVGANARRGELQCLALARVEACERFARRLARHFQVRGRARRPLVEAPREIDERSISPRAHGLEDLRRGALDALVQRRLEGDEACERGLEARLARGKAPRLSHGRPCGTPR